MPRYRVTVEYIQRRDIGVWAPDEDAAMVKGAQIVEGWDNVTRAEGIEAEAEVGV